MYRYTVQYGPPGQAPAANREEEAWIYAHTDELLVLSSLSLPLPFLKERLKDTTAGLRRMRKAKALSPLT